MLSMLLGNDSLLADSASAVAQVASQVVPTQSDDTGAEEQWGGSKKGKAPNVERDFVGAYKKLVNHYFSGEDSLYNEEHFERRFRMKRDILNKIYGAIHSNHLFIVRQDQHDDWCNGNY